MPQQKLQLITLENIKGWYHAGIANNCPDGFLWECQDAVIKNGVVVKRDLFLAAESGLADNARFIYFVGKKGESNPYLVCFTASHIYGKDIRASSWIDIIGSRLNPTYASTFAFLDGVYVFDNANNPGKWSYAAGGLVDLATPPTELCAEAVLHSNAIFACQAATTKDYVFMTEPLRDVFKALWALRIPDERGGFSALRLFSQDQYLICLTDKCPTLITGTGINSYRVYAKGTLQGMRSDALRCACQGELGVYYLDNRLDIQLFDGNDNYNITTPFFDTYLKNDILIQALPKSCISADDRYIYFSYASKEVSTVALVPNRILVFDEHTKTWVGDLRAITGVSHASFPRKTSPTKSLIGRMVNASGATSLIQYPCKRGLQDMDSMYEYDCSAVPSAATPTWTLTGTDFASVSENILTITNNGLATSLYTININSTNSIGTSGEVLAAFVTANNPEYLSILSICDGTRGVAVSLSASGVRLQEYTNINNSSSLYSLTSTDYHKYRLVLKDNTAYLYVDDNSTAVCTLTLAATTTNNFVHIGSLYSTANPHTLKWKYIKWGTLTTNLSESFLSTIQTKDYTPAYGMIVDFDTIESEAIVQSAGTLTVACYIDGVIASAPTRSTSLTASGSRYGDDDAATVTRTSIIYDPWYIPRSSTYLSSGRRIGVKYTHTSTEPFTVNRVLISSYLSLSEQDKEIAK